MTPKFNNVYTTFDEWLAAHPQATPYQQRIVRLHKKHPEASLSQLRGHAKKDEQKLKTAEKVSVEDFTEFSPETFVKQGLKSPAKVSVIDPTEFYPETYVKRSRKKNPEAIS